MTCEICEKEKAQFDVSFRAKIVDEDKMNFVSIRICEKCHNSNSTYQNIIEAYNKRVNYENN